MLKKMLILLICLVFLHPVKSKVISCNDIFIQKEAEKLNTKKNDGTGLFTLFVGNADEIIECGIDQQALFEFAEQNGYNHLILYGIKNYIKGLPKEQVGKLGDFIQTAHNKEITISINVPSFSGSGDIRNYWDQQPDINKKYDALHLEKEYWNGTGSKCENQQAAFNEYISELKNVNNFCHNSVNGAASRNIICETYLGNPCHKNSKPTKEGQEQVNQVVQLTDRVYLAYYKSDPFNPSLGIFHHKFYRLDYFSNAKDEAGNPVNADVSILFNAYQDDPNENDDMFDWLNEMADKGTPYEELFAQPFDYWMNGENGFIQNRDHNVNNLIFPKSSGLQNLNILGYGWYKYQSLQEVAGINVGNCTSQKSLIARQNNNHLLQPNPASQDITITLPGHPENGRFLVYDVNGKIILKGNLLAKINRIGISSLPNNVYFIKIWKGLGSDYFVEKLVIRN